MRLDLSTRRRLWLQQMLFLLLFGALLILLAGLSIRYPIRLDWTASGRHTLSAASQALLARLDQPIRITAYVRERSPMRESIRRLVERYQRHQPDITLNFVNPDLWPAQARQLDIRAEGELYVEYGGRGEKLQQPGEQALTQTLQRLSRPQNRLVVFLDGHGERKPQGVANHDWGQFGRELENLGVQMRSLSLDAETPVPPETAALVIASPQTPLTPAAAQAVLDYVRRGGNLLWTLEPGDPLRLPALAALLGLSVRPGVIVDANAPRLGIHHPSFIPIVDYAPHPISAALRSPALLPQAVALEIQPVAEWRATSLLESASSSWSETGALDAPLQLNADAAEQVGPLTVGVALSRPKPGAADTAQQRVVVIGDSDFLSNTYLGNGANLELGLNSLNWLAWDEALIVIPSRTLADPRLNLSQGALAGLAALFLLILPGGFLTCAGLIWRWRRH